MAKNRKYTVKLKRRIEFKTNYKRRLKLVMSRSIRLVIRPHLNNIILQFVEFHENGDKVLVSVNSSSLNKLGWKANRGNIPSAYLTGLYAGLIAKKKNIKHGVLDIGNFQSVKGSRIYAALKGVVDSGVNIPHSRDILPHENAISGKIIEEYAKKLEKNNTFYNRQFGR